MSSLRLGQKSTRGLAELKKTGFMTAMKLKNASINESLMLDIW